MKKQIDEIIDDLESQYDCQGSANYDGEYTRKIMTVFKKQLIKEKKKLIKKIEDFAPISMNYLDKYGNKWVNEKVLLDFLDKLKQ